LIAACGCNRGGNDAANSGVSSTAQSSDNQVTIAVIPKSVGGEFWETVEEGAREAAKELNVQIKWEGPHAETELAEQNKIIENMVNLDVDGMALAPLNNRTMRESV
jgi:ribose transport system substrate-binding protein